MVEAVKVKKRKVAWGITGAGDKIAEIVEVMKDLKKQSEDFVDIDVYISKAADTMLKFYRLDEEIKKSFGKVMVEVNANSPFLAAWMQSGKYEFLLIAPCSSNSVAKIVNSISDTMLTNAAIMSLKAFQQVYILPTDYTGKRCFYEVAKRQRNEAAGTQRRSRPSAKAGSHGWDACVGEPREDERQYFWIG